MEYRIVKCDYFERGKVLKTKYRVQKKTGFWFFAKWLDVTEHHAYGGDVYTAPITFSDKQSAEEFIDEITNKGNPGEGWRELIEE